MYICIEAGNIIQASHRERKQAFIKRTSGKHTISYGPHAANGQYSIVHEIVHCESLLLVREIFMCFQVIVIVHQNHGYSTSKS